MKWVFIINSISGQGKSLREINKISKIMENYNQKFEIVKTEYAGHATKIASSYTQNDDVCIVAMGGDGTIYEVINGINRNVPMAIIPTGSGNDFSRMIVKEGEDFEITLTNLIDYKESKVDVCEAIIDNDRIIRFLNGASMGIDADINYDIVKIIRNTKIHKNIAYNLSILKHLTTHKSKEVIIHMDDEVRNLKCNLIAIMNGKYYGNGFIPTPDSNCQDGLLDICYTNSLNLIELINVLPKYKKGTHKDEKKITITKAKRIKISSKTPLCAQSDGENFFCKELDIKILDEKQRIFIPKNSTIIQ